MAASSSSTAPSLLLLTAMAALKARLIKLTSLTPQDSADAGDYEAWGRRFVGILVSDESAAMCELVDMLTPARVTWSR